MFPLLVLLGACLLTGFSTLRWWWGAALVLLISLAINVVPTLLALQVDPMVKGATINWSAKVAPVLLYTILGLLLFAVVRAPRFLRRRTESDRERWVRRGAQRAARRLRKRSPDLES